MREFLRIIRRSFTGRYALTQLSAAIITVGLVEFGIDWHYFLYMHTYAPPQILFAADVIGIIVPVFIPTVLIALGRINKDERLTRIGWTIAQAELAAFLVVLCYKSIAGRVSPPFFGPIIDESHNFNFGFLRESVYGGWPSSHTALAFAAVASVWNVLARRPVLRWSLFTYALFIGLGEAIGFHWFSEVISGALVGTVIGLAASQVEELSREKPRRI